MDNQSDKEKETSFHLRKVEHDAIEDISTDALMENVSKSIMGKGFIISVLFHVIFITLLSLGFIKLCFEYKTLNPRPLIAQQEEAKEEALKEQKRAEAKQAAIEKAKSEAAVEQQHSNNTQQTSDLPDGSKPVPEVLQNINEVSHERPVQSSLESLDDDFL